jgi:hypothetical protein
MKHTIGTVIILVFSFQLQAQDIDRKLDTLKSYDVNLDEVLTTWGKKYMANGKEISKEQYMKYKENWAITEQCHPCVMVTYDHLDRIKHQAIQYFDCLVGDYIEYYPDGKIKTKGAFKIPPGNDWSNLKLRQLCSVRDGKWIYYNESGKAELIETYVDGRVTNSEKPNDTDNNKPALGKIKGLFKSKETEASVE